MAPAVVPKVGRPLVYSTTWCGDCVRASRVLRAENVEYDEVNIDRDAAAADLVVSLNRGMRSVPTIVFPDGSLLVEPSNATLKAKVEQLREAGLLT